jgi:hypothetical protein
MRIIEYTIRLKAGQYAGNVLSFRQIQNIILQGGCGSGKSTLAVDHKDPFIIIAPTTVIIRQLASDTCQVIEAGVTPDFEKYTQFACTYDSLPRLCQVALEAGLNPYAIPLTVDECHHLLSDGYKGGRLNACMDEVRKFEKVTFTSATVPPLVPYFEDFSRTVLTRDPRPIKWSYAIGSDIAMAVRCLKQGFRVLLHINNKKKIQVVKEYFEGLGYRVEYIDSDNKNEMLDRGLSDKRLPDADIYLCTSVFNDGISVHEHAQKYVVILSEESLRHLGPNEIVQVSQRLRDFVPHHVYLMRSSDEFDHDSRDFLLMDYINEYINMLENAEKKTVSDTELYLNMIKGYDANSRDYNGRCQALLEKMFPLKDDSLIIFNEEKQIFEPNLRAIGEYVYSMLQRKCHASRYMMDYWLSLHDFEFCGIVEVEKETELEKDIIETTKSLKKADRQVMRDAITQFETYEDALNASRIDTPTTYSQAAKVLPFEKFAEGREEEDRGELRLQYRQALRETVKEAEVKQKAAEIYVSHVQHLCATGAQFKDAVGQAKTDLVNSTLTGQALKRLRYAKELQAIARGVRNPDIAKVADGAFVAEVLQSVTIDEPIDRSATNASFEHAFRHSDDARKRLTVTPRFPKSKPTSEAPTHELLNHALMLAKRLSRKKMTKEAIAEERKILSLLTREELSDWIEKTDKEVREKEVARAAKSTWKKRKEFLNYFFEIERSTRKIDGKRSTVWIPTKALY